MANLKLGYECGEVLFIKSTQLLELSCDVLKLRNSQCKHISPIHQNNDLASDKTGRHIYTPLQSYITFKINRGLEWRSRMNGLQHNLV